MKLVHTILLLLAACGLLAFIVFVERERPTTMQEQVQDARLASFRPGNINVVEVENTGAKIRLALRDGAWKVEDPFEDLADPEVVHQVIDTLAHVNVVRKTRINDGNERVKTFKELGLDTDRQSVLLKGDGPQIKVIFGQETASASAVYARLTPSSEVAQIKREVRDVVLREPDQFRDPLLTRLEPKHVVEIRVRRPDGDMELELKDGFWQFRKPLQALADNQLIFDTLKAIASAKIEKFVANTQDNAAEYGLHDPKGIVHLVLANGDKVVLKLGVETEDKKSVYVTVQGRPGIFQASDACRAFVSLAPDQWRDRRVLRVPPEVISQVEVQVPGKSSTVINRQGYGWMLEVDGKTTPAQQSHVTGLIQWLSESRAEDFVSSGKARLGEFGLDNPSLSLRLKTVSAKAQGGLAQLPPSAGQLQDSEWPEEVFIRFGRIENGLVYVDTPFQNAIITLPAQVLEAMPQEPYQWRTLALQAFIPQHFAWMEYQQPGGVKARFDRREDGAWVVPDAAANVDERDRYVNEAAAALGKLRGLEYVAERAQPEHGLDNPIMVILFQLMGEDTTRRLTVGAPMEDRGYYAHLEGLDSIFVLSRTDYDVLTLPLEQRK